MFWSLGEWVAGLRLNVWCWVILKAWLLAKVIFKGYEME